MIALQQNRRNRPAIPIRRPRVLREAYQASRERVPANTVGLTQGSWEPTTDGLNGHESGQLSSGQDVIAYGNLLEFPGRQHSLVDALIAAAEHDQALFDRQISNSVLIENRPLGREEDSPPPRGTQAGSLTQGCAASEAMPPGLAATAPSPRRFRRFHRPVNRFARHDHAWPASIGAVVDLIVRRISKGSDIEDLDLQNPPSLRPPQEGRAAV